MKGFQQKSVLPQPIGRPMLTRSSVRHIDVNRPGSLIHSIIQRTTYRNHARAPVSGRYKLPEQEYEIWYLKEEPNANARAA